MIRLRAEIASLRATLGQQPPTKGAEPIGCPLPGMCSMVAATSTLRARVAELEAAMWKILDGDHPEGTSLAVNNNYRELAARLQFIARTALERKSHA